MAGGKAYGAGEFAGANPHRTGSADQCEWIVADQLRRTLQREGNGIVRVSADGVKLIGYAHDDARGVGPICYQFVIICQQSELAVDTFARKCFGHHELSADVSFGAQITPTNLEVTQIEFRQVEDERRIFQVVELGALGIDLRQLDPCIVLDALIARPRS